MRGFIRQLVLFDVADEIRLDFHASREKRPEADQFHYTNSLQSLQENNYVPVGHPNKFMDFRGCANKVQVRRGWLLDSGIVLRHNSKQLFVTVKGVQQCQRPFAPDRQRLNAAREQYRIPDGQNRKLFGNWNRFIAHWVPLEFLRQTTPFILDT